MFKKTHFYTLFMGILLFSFCGQCNTVSDLSLEDAWMHVRSVSPEIKSLTASSQIAELQQKQAHAWAPLQIGYLDGNRSVLGAPTGSLGRLNVSQRLPVGSDRQIGIINAELYSDLLYQDNYQQVQAHQALLVNTIYKKRIYIEELQLLSERLKSVNTIRQHFLRTQALTPHLQLERSLIELRLREIELQVLDIKRELAATETQLKIWNLDHVNVVTTWFSHHEAQKINSLSPSDTPALKMNLIEQSRLQTQSELFYFFPGIDLQYEETRFRGNATEVERLFGVSFSVPLWGTADKSKRIANVQALRAQFNVEKQKQKDLMQWNEIQLLAKQNADYLKLYPQTQNAEFKKNIKVFEAALRKGQISIIQYLDVDEQSHRQISLFYQKQQDLVSIWIQASAFTETDLIENIRKVSTP